jgi:two-component system, LytTR family, sensor histidine kinase AlgZ
MHPIARAVLINTSISFIVPVITICFYPRVSSTVLLNSFAVSLAYSFCVGSLFHFSMEWLWLRSLTWQPVLKWFFRVAMVLAVATIGSLGATAILKLFWRSVPYWGIFWDGYPFALLITLGVTTVISVYEGLKYKLEATQLELKQKELDRERANKLATVATLSSLESRIHPHFLFNTINSISSLIHEDPDKAERLLGKLADLLRFSLDAPQLGLVPLAHEMKIVEDYLEIEKARLGDRLRHTLDWDPALRHRVPPLSIQTLVENSIKYAVAPRREGGSVTVRVCERNGQLDVQIQDDGPGFDLSAIVSGHGIENVEARLKALFSGHPGLNITSKNGCLVHFTVPLA